MLTEKESQADRTLVALMLHLLRLPAQTACSLHHLGLAELLRLAREKGLRRHFASVDLAATRAQAEKILPQLGQQIELVLFSDRFYPPLLRQIPRPPYLLYARGDKKVLALAGYSVVGSRLASGWGLHQAYLLGRALANAKQLLVSGLARGIDEAAMLGQLDGGGATVGVLGCGLNYPYPRATLRVRHLLLQQGGCLLSLLPPDTPAWPANFPARNAIISGLTMHAVLLDVGRHSGALLTANSALEQGREVSVIGHSPGTDRLAEEGAEQYIDYREWLQAMGHGRENPPWIQSKGDASLQLASDLLCEFDGCLRRYNGRCYRIDQVKISSG